MKPNNTITKPFVHILQKQETITSLATKFNLERNSLISFHNEHSSIENRISFTGTIPNHLTQILLPAFKIQNKKEAIQLRNQNSLNFDFESLDHKYGVVIHIVSDKEPKRFHYITALKCEKAFEFIYDVTFNKGPVYIDYKKPDFLAENLAESLSKPLYPIATKISKSGRIQEVTNQPEIFERWALEKPKLETYFQSTIGASQIKATHNAYKNVLAIEKALRRDFFLNLYCSGIYDKYMSALNISNTVYLPIYPFMKGIQYSVKQTIQPYLSSTNTIIVHQKGTVNDPRTSTDILQKKDIPTYEGEPLTGELDIQYELSTKEHLIKSIIGSITLLVNKKLLKKITIEAYLLT